MRKIISSVLITSLLMMGGYLMVEPEMIKAVNDQIVVTQHVSAEISISSPADVAMSNSIPGMTGGSATGSATWVVVTNNVEGFNMSIAANTAPAMMLGGDPAWVFTNYTPTTTTAPDYNWGVPANKEAEFGFTVEPQTTADTDPFFKDNGTGACNTGTANTVNTCWWPLSTTAKQIINRPNHTAEAGEAEVVKFKAESSAKYLKEGNYTATVTATAVMN